MRDLRNNKNENALNFSFLLNHKLKKIPEFAPAEEQVESINKSVRECIDKHAPEKMKPISEAPNDWITNKIKNAITRRNTLYEKLIIVFPLKIKKSIKQLETRWVPWSEKQLRK